MKTNQDARSFVLQSLNGMEMTEKALRRCVYELYDTAHSYNFEGIPEDIYWSVVNKYSDPAV